MTLPADNVRKPKALDERYYLASQWALTRRRFRKHKLAMVGLWTIVAFLFVGVAFCEFFSPNDIHRRNPAHILTPPMRVRIFDQGMLRSPFVYGHTRIRSMETFQMEFTIDHHQVYPIRFFAKGAEYRLFGILSASRRLLTVEEPGYLYLFGTDRLGRDLFSRTVSATRISLSVGLVGVLLSFVLGCILGGVSGYLGGTIDNVIQRLIEFLISIPTIPLWMALAAAVPLSWPPLRVYFAITVILSIIGWTGLGRVVRGKVISLREEDFVMAAQISGTGEFAIITKHLLPGFFSYLIVHLTLSIPGMILAETSLSFLGLGLRPPVVSWGVLLSEAQNISVLYMSQWLLIPGLFVIAAVLAFNFLGDGLRDAADPYR